MSVDPDERDTAIQVDDHDYRTIDRRLVELKRRLNGQRGQTPIVDLVLGHIQAAIEDRYTTHGSAALNMAAIISGSDPSTVPLSAAQTYRLTWMHITEIGCTVDTFVSMASAYGKHGVYVAQAMLRSFTELQDECGRKAAHDIASCFEHSNAMLRLPTSKEIMAAKLTGWWKPLVITNGTQQQVLRMPTIMIGTVPLVAIPAIDQYMPGSLISESITTLGELMNLSREEFAEAWRNAYGGVMRDQRQEPSAVGEIASWLRSNGLGFRQD